MPRTASQLGRVVVLCFAVSAGCQKSVEQSSTQDQQAVREAVTAFQEALKTRDSEKLWSLLDDDSRSDAERAAKNLREAYAKASAKEKAQQEEALGVSSAELAALTGKGFLKTKRFHGEWEELPGSKIDTVTVEGNAATVGYTEDDGDKKKLTLVRQEGKWRLSNAMP
jgi:hypothetical protein